MSELSAGASLEPLEKLVHSGFNHATLDYLRARREAVWRLSFEAGISGALFGAQIPQR